jgi:uncharacterized cupin superfamily protein
MTRTTPIAADAIDLESGSNYPEPFKSQMGPSHWRCLGEAFGLTQFGFNLETLMPGAMSSLRHWHTLSEELIYVTQGELLLRTNDGEFTLTPGMCMGFKAGDKNAHHLINRSHAPAHFVVVGTRVPGDKAFYPDVDFTWFNTESGTIAAHKDGRPYPTE